MFTQTLTIVSLLAAVAVAQSTAAAYGQCGGTGFNGPQACGSGYSCYSVNQYYYQCTPGAGTAPLPTTTAPAPTPTVPTTLTTTTVAAPPPTTPATRSTTPAQTSVPATPTTPGSGSGGPGPGQTLQSGWYWIRAVESPYFHSYLQTKPTDAPGTALLSSYLTAGQFQIISGQLVENTGNGGRLYMNVQDPTDKTQRTLATTFNTTQNTYGTFAFSGDTVTWVDPDMTRPNTAAFYVCGSSQLFINTGAYAYQTPAGCYDVDIHYYNAAQATLRRL